MLSFLSADGSNNKDFQDWGWPVVGWRIFLKSDVEKICANITSLVLMIHVVTWAADFHS